MKNYSSFDFLRKISFERVGGSDKELNVANMILDECKKYNVDAAIEDFEIDGYDIKKASLVVEGTSFEVTGVGMSGSTPNEGITYTSKFNTYARKRKR